MGRRDEGAAQRQELGQKGETRTDKKKQRTRRREREEEAQKKSNRANCFVIRCDAGDGCDAESRESEGEKEQTKEKREG
jgi:mannitol-specific phosphotransferase system IIBC component